MRLLALLLALLLSVPAAAQERVLSFHSAIQVARDGGLSVAETIEVQVEGREIRRGILRDFPTDYRDRLGRKVTVPFGVVSVTRDGAPEHWTTERKANGVSVRIGNPNVLLPHGRHVYRIVYRTQFQVGFFDAHDELYWNVNGNGWTFAMDRISAEVDLPAAVPAAQLKAEAYTGPFGARGRNYTAGVRSGGASWQTTRWLGAGEGLTIVFSFPKGVVAPPTLRARFGRWFADNRGEAYGAAGLLLMLAFLYWRWHRVGRDPRAGPLFPRYEAPTGLGPAAVRYLDQMNYDPLCFTAAMLGLGQRGFVKIHHSARGYVVTPTGQATEFTPGDKAVAALVPGRQPLTLTREHNPAVTQALSAQTAELEKYFGEHYFARNSASTFLATMMGIASVLTMWVLEAALAPTLLAAGVAVAAMAVAVKVMPAYSLEGRRLKDQVEGLRQYLSVAERDDLALQKRPPRTPEEFAKFLPYAVALGVEQAWTRTFAQALGAAALAAATADYYTSNLRDHDYSSAGGFAKAVGDMGSTISSASTPPGSSSGSSDSGGSSSGGGGGSSGGGGGGGGGSGW